jgi:hypothetical protein
MMMKDFVDSEEIKIVEMVKNKSNGSQVDKLSNANNLKDIILNGNISIYNLVIIQSNY